MAERNEEYQTHHAQYLERQKEILQENLSDSHSNLVLDFLYDNRSELAPSTRRNYCRELRYLIDYSYGTDEYSDDPEEWDSDQWERLIRRVARERDIGEGSRRNICYAVRNFVEWSSKSPASKDDIDAPKISHSKIDEETVLDPDEIVELIETAHTERDSAIIAVMYEGAVRRTALIQLDVQDYLTERFARIRLPHKEGVKTGAGEERPLNWSAGYLDRWLNQHPNPDDPEAPLFCSIRSQDDGSRLSSHAIYTMLQRVADKSDVDSDRVHPHALRHARATQMRKSDNLDKKDIETMMGWTESTPMHGRYEHTTSTEDASRTARRMGVDIGDDGDHVIEECPRCGTNLPTDSRYCPTCTLRITAEPPEWWRLFSEICKDTDPLYKQYDAVPSTVPRLDELDITELEHVYEILMMGEAKMSDPINDEYISHSETTEHPYDGVTGFESEEDADNAMDIVSDIGNMMGSIYKESPEKIELVKDSVDLTNIQGHAMDADEED